MNSHQIELTLGRFEVRSVFGMWCNNCQAWVIEPDDADATIEAIVMVINVHECEPSTTIRPRSDADTLRELASDFVDLVHRVDRLECR